MLPPCGRRPDNFFASSKFAKNAVREPSAIRPIPPDPEGNGASELPILPEFSQMKSSDGESLPNRGGRAGVRCQNTQTLPRIPEAPRRFDQ
jgi:hypothetical protein